MTATFVGSAHYLSTGDDAQFTIAKATPTVIWTHPSDISTGTALGPEQLDATASVPGNFDYAPAMGIVLPSGQGQVLSVTFVPTDSVDYDPVAASTTINVNVATEQPTPPQVTAIAPVSSGKGLTSFTVSYNEPLTAGSASNAVLYRVFAAVTKFVKKHKETLYTKSLAIRGVSPNSSGNAVTISLAKPYRGKVQVTVQGTVTASNGASSSVDFPMVVQ